jgi:hypothetical protein
MIAEKDLTDLVTKLKDAAGSNLVSVILYGSAATGEFHAGHSDLNILCLMQSLGREDLSKLHATLSTSFSIPPMCSPSNCWTSKRLTAFFTAKT